LKERILVQPHATSQPERPPAETRRKGKFNLNRAQVVDENFIEFLRTELASPAASDGRRRSLDDPLVSGKKLTGRDALDLFETQLVTRHQDLESRAMRARNEGFYTIGSAGHEGNAVVGRLTRHTDMAFLHYRSGAFMAERARKVPGIDFTRDTMLSFAAGRDDPISGGRHKVWGSVPLGVPPQTSTIASHLPKAVGTALLLARAHRAGTTPVIPPDGIIVCSFGDASCNHAVAQTAFNVAAWASHQHLPVPILFVCEDNGIGISVETPHDWIEHSFGRRHGIRYFRGDGLDLVDAYETAFDAAEYCRRRRSPVFLHLKVVRLLGHAGSDAETEYHSWEQIEAAEAKDPLLASARLVVEHGLLTPAEVIELYEQIRERVRIAAADAAKRPKLSSAEEIIAPLAPFTPDAVAVEARRPPPAVDRLRMFGGDDQLPEKLPPRHMAALINLGLHDLLLKYPESILFGEDVARKGGVYHVTTGLLGKFGPARVFNTLLDETSILGLAIGAGHLGLLPIPEIQYLAYYHNAEDQIRGEAASLQFFSKDQYRNPMVIRIQGWGYQKGFGGHFHNDNSIAALRDVPGLIVATPARGDDAVKMMRTCMALARVDGRVIAFIEPIALYMTRDLHEPKDAGWSFAYPPPGEFIPLGEPGVYHPEHGDLTILTFANGLYMSLRAARTLQEVHGLRARVVDLRWLNPLNENAVVEHALASRNVLVVDESRKTGGIAEAVMAVIHEHCGSEVRARRLNARDTYIPLGPAAEYVLPVERDIVAAARSLMEGRNPDAKRDGIPQNARKTPENRGK
jgi:2-oxoisovalerate dehydrogenase E1 component